MSRGWRGSGFVAAAVAGGLAVAATFAACGRDGAGPDQATDASELVAEGLAAHTGGDTTGPPSYTAKPSTTTAATRSPSTTWA